MAADTEIVQAVDPFLNKDGKRLVRALVALFRLTMLGGIVWTGLGVRQIGEHLANAPTRSEFEIYQREQRERWLAHERNCEELIRRMNNSLNVILRARSPRDSQNP